jgi:hypothetical protein
MKNYWRSKPPIGVGIDRSHHLAAGLKACWLWNEGSGGVASDLVQNRKATLAAGYTLAPGPRGTALNCAAASTQLVTFPALTTGLTYTLEQWWYFRSFPASYSTLLANSGGGGGLFVQATNHFTCYYSGDHNGTTVLAANTWYHVGLSVQQQAGTWYVNGHFDGTIASVQTFDLVQIGSDTVSERADGWNLLTRIWVGRALTANDFRELYGDPYGMMLPPVWKQVVSEALVGPQAVTYPKLERFHPRGMERGMYP